MVDSLPSQIFHPYFTQFQASARLRASTLHSWNCLNRDLDLLVTRPVEGLGLSDSLISDACEKKVCTSLGAGEFKSLYHGFRSH
jgi:hypothetical protein